MDRTDRINVLFPDIQRNHSGHPSERLSGLLQGRGFT